MKKHTIRSVLKKFSARATLQGHLGATQERHYENKTYLMVDGSNLHPLPGRKLLGRRRK